MELSIYVLFILVILLTVNSAKVLAITNSTSETGIFGKSSDISYVTGSYTKKIKECDCGFLSNGCHLINGKKLCDCGFRTAQNGEKCQSCNCGVLSTKCYFQNGQQMCDCLPDTAVTSYKTCEWCDCGYRYIKCEFQGYKKVCTCPDRYIEKSGKCEECDCGFNSISCTLNYLGVRKCTCEPGYVSKPRNSYSDDEKCIVYSSTSSWRIATYVMGAILGVIIFGLIVFIVGKKASI